ncbi:MATE family efflux transporter [Anaerostipes caccae]|uniref:MATE family efflux transporter n=1 Tax=Anaerostipes caccae TaxID=105841 RepID=UPI001D09045A|nr:MATE family efflux transporter [Anaerostipes caccae]MCB6294178.1 MATE family efflux transporter [Anaerostipes caccae]MCB6336071.1 MATE family efflux transporter [Anaerostipes caccae]MCB6339174.1 MATE family efflux transporter [Anaerostipes caccae]MCB6351900.1 MATE family efflux transporter [Anaerostipes caccae]MCB6359474.1 MATE family efflux transporter [Anaerostipes caccae]
MKEMSCFKVFLKYSSLNVLGMLGLSFYILADTFFVSRALGADGLTALNLAIPVYSFINGSGLMLGIGGGTKYSIVRSQKNKPKANQAFTNAVVLTGIVAGIFCLLGIFCSGPMVRMLGANESVFQMTKTYLQVILLFAPMFMANNLLLCFVRNDGNPHLAMAAMICGSLSNIILDYIFIFPLGMGLFGAAFATGLAPVISILILSPYLINKRNQFHLKKCRLSANLLLDIFSSGLPSLITEVSSGIVIIVFNMILLRIAGNIGVAAYGVIANLSLVVMAVYTGIAQGIQPVLSSNYGAGNHKNVTAILRYAVTAVIVISACVYLCIFFGAEPITGVFNSSHNKTLQDIAAAGLKIYFTASVFAGFNVVAAVYFTSTEYPRPAHIISILRGFVIIIPMAFLLSALGGITGVWAAFPTTELLVSLIGMILLFQFHKVKKEDS